MPKPEYDVNVYTVIAGSRVKDYYIHCVQYSSENLSFTKVITLSHNHAHYLDCSLMKV